MVSACGGGSSGSADTTSDAGTEDAGQEDTDSTRGDGDTDNGRGGAGEDSGTRGGGDGDGNGDGDEDADAATSAPDGGLTDDAGGGDGDGEPPLMCAEGLANCDGKAENGCEVTLANNLAHCGACGRDCSSIGATCSADGCSAKTLYSSLPFGTDNRQARTWAFGNGAAYQMGASNYVVRRYPLDGSGGSTIWNGGGATGGTEALLVTPTHVIWAQRGTPPAVLAKAHNTDADTLPTQLFTPEYQPTFMVLAGGTYYWASGDYQSNDPAGYIYSRPENGMGAGTRIVTTNQGTHGAIAGLAVSSDALYWVTSAAGEGTAFEIRTAPLTGGATHSVVPGGAISANSIYLQVTLRTVGKKLYFNRNVGTAFTNGIYVYEPGDAEPTQLVSAEDVSSFVLDDSAIYYIRQNVAGVWKAPLSGGAGKKISNLAAGTEVVGHDTDSVYVSSSGSGGSTLYRVLK